MSDSIRDRYLEEVGTSKQLLSLIEEEDFFKKIEGALECLVQAVQKNAPILVCGNGGSASDALHISGELVGRFLKERRAVDVICLSSNVSVLTAWANDVGYDTVFSRQVEAHGRADGVLWAISTSGNSKNVIKAAETARNLKMKVLSMTGMGGGALAKFSDVLLDVPSTMTPRVQEMHLVIYHFLCARLEETVV